MRKIIWYCDFEGAGGKTDLSRYLLITEPKKWLVSKCMGTARDGATVVANCLATGWNGHGCILDIPRQTKNHKSLYETIEAIKDGFITTQKYSGNTYVFKRGWMIVFANWLPKFYMLSRDRWDVRILKRIGTQDVYYYPYKVTDNDMINPDDKPQDE